MRRYLGGGGGVPEGLEAGPVQGHREGERGELLLAGLELRLTLLSSQPNQSAGSDDVFLCTSEAEVRAGFDKINGAINGLGVKNEGVLIQEFLEGKE